MANTGDHERRPHPGAPGARPPDGAGAHGAAGRPAGNDDDPPRWPGGGVKGEDEGGERDDGSSRRDPGQPATPRRSNQSK